MTNIKYYVTCATHIDLAWKRNEEEMSEMITVLAVRLLDELERNPQFKYLLEQAYHYRALAVRRPDLVERLKYYVAQGRLEFMGAMASTLETNVPCGESFVRNQLLGMEWVKANFDVTVKTGWLMDTFGINAQVPQILKQFGISRLMANRFGGNKYQDVFYSVGLDGSRLLVVGRDVYSSYLRPGYVSEVCTRSWEDMDRLFRHAIEKTGDGPYMVTPMTENEMLVSFRPEYYIKEQNQKAGAEIWKYATPSEFLDALQTLEEQWPEEPGDLNPEFTATFSQRIPIRLQNRKAENLLLEAEKWALLTRLTDWKQQLEDAWWTMSYIHFHDVFTGSHPTNVFNTLMGKIYRVQQTSADILNKALNNVKEPGITTQDMISVKAFNGLPFERNDLIKVDLPSPDTFTTMVMCDGVSIPFETRDNQVLFRHTLPPVGCQTFELLQGSKPETFPQFSRVKAGAIENEFILLQCDETMGIVQLVNKKTGKQVLKNAKDLLVIQQDVGSFQIEQPVNAEVAFIAGGLSVEVCRNEGNSSRVRLSGRFPKLPWAGKDNKLQWTMEFSLYPGKEALYLKLDLDWVGEASRIRLKLPTCIDTAEAIYEVPLAPSGAKPMAQELQPRGSGLPNVLLPFRILCRVAP